MYIKTKHVVHSDILRAKTNETCILLLHFLSLLPTEEYKPVYPS